MPLALRKIGDDDYAVIDDGVSVGRIRLAIERTPEIWVWHVQVHVPGCGEGEAHTMAQAKADFRESFDALRKRIGPERYAAAIAFERIPRGETK